MWPSEILFPPPECSPSPTKVFQSKLFGCSKVQWKSITWRWSATAWVVQFIDTKHVRLAVRGGVTSVTHPMTHTQWRQAVTVVVIQEQRLHTILGPVHKRVLSCLRFLSFQSCRVPGLLVFNLSVVSFFMIMERLPNSMGSWVLRVKLPPINSSFIVNSKQFRSIFPSPGG